MSGSHSHLETITRARELIERGAPGDAEALLRELIQDVQSRLGEDASELVEPLYRYAHALSKQHAWNVACPEQKDALERALRIACKTYGDESAMATRMREPLANHLMATGETESAVLHMEVVVRVTERAQGEGVILAHTLNGLADMLLNLGRHAEAAATYERVFDMAGDRGNEIMDFVTRFGWGKALVLMGRNSDAIPLLERALERCLKRYGERNKVTIWVREWLERARQGLKKDGPK